MAIYIVKISDQMRTLAFQKKRVKKLGEKIRNSYGY